MNVRDLLIEDELILSCVKINPTQEELETINNLIPQVKDWDYFCRNIIRIGFGPLFYKKLSQLSNHTIIPEFVQRKLKKSYLKTLSMNMRLSDAFSKIVERFNTEGIQVVTLKGIYLTEWLYADIALRQCSDIDLLVREENGKKCLQILDELGFKTESEEYKWVKAEIIHYPARLKDDISVEIHIRLNAVNEEYDLNLNQIFEKIQPIKIHNTSAYALDFYDMLIHVCIHMEKHFRRDHIQFNSLSDITNILVRFQNDIIWDYLIERCVQFNCEKDFFKNMILVHNYFNAPLPQWIIEKYSTLLDSKHEERFLKFLKIEKIERASKTPIQQHISMIKGLAKPSDSLLYFFRIIFPSKSFMIEKYIKQFIINNEELIIKNAEENQYNVSEDSKQESNFEVKKKEPTRKLLIINYELLIRFWWLWYPYRWWVGVKGVVKLMIND